MAVFLLTPIAVFPSWLLGLMVGLALLALGIGPLASWRKTARVSRGLVVAVIVATIFVIVGFDCSVFGGWIPDWLCFQIA